MKTTLSLDSITVGDIKIHYREITAIRPIGGSENEFDAPRTRILAGLISVELDIGYRQIHDWYEGPHGQPQPGKDYSKEA